MRIKKWMAALLALCLLTGLCPAATMEDLQAEVVSGAVEPEVSEADGVDARGLYVEGEAIEPDAEPTELSADLAGEVMATNDDSYSWVHITKPVSSAVVEPGDVEVWLRYDNLYGDAQAMAAAMSPTTVQIWRNNELVDTKSFRPGGLDFTDEGARYLTLTLNTPGWYELRASVPGTRTEYSAVEFYVGTLEKPSPTVEPSPTPVPPNPVGEGKKMLRITSPANGGKLSVGSIPVSVVLVRPASGNLDQDAVEELYTPIDIEVTRNGEHYTHGYVFDWQLPEECFEGWKAFEFDAELGGTYEIQAGVRDREPWDSVTIQVDGPDYHATPEGENPGYHVIPKQAEYTVDLNGGDKTIRIGYTLSSDTWVDDLYSESQVGSDGWECVSFVEGGYYGEGDLEWDGKQYSADFWLEYTARKVGTAKVHLYAERDDVLYDHREVLIHVIDSAESKTAAPTAQSTATPAPVRTSIKKAKVTVSDQVYTGKKLKPSVKVKLNGKTLKKGTDYAVKYSNNTKVGTATVKVTGRGAYKGTVKTTFRINPKQVKDLKLKAGKKKLTASWKKVSGVSGYQIEYGLKKSFKGAKAQSVKKAKTKYTLKKLKSKKTYYVRIRCYKKVNGRKYFSAWSRAVQLKTK